MGSIFQTGPAMGNLFSAGPQLLGQVQLAGTGDVVLYRRRKQEELLSGPSDVVRRPDREGTRIYCDPSVDPLCSNPYEGPIPVELEGNNRSFQANASERETPPNLNCNVAWDPGCPRPQPNQTMVPYVPNSYLRGSTPIRIGGVEYVAPAIGRTAIRQKRQF